MLRTLTANDLPKLLEIEQAAQISPWVLETFQRCLEMNSHGWVIELGDKIVGFILVLNQKSEAHILNFCVHPEFQRRGYGQQLLEFTITQASQQKMSITFLEVRRSNQSAIALYRKLGFKAIGERRGYYSASTGDREDAIVFAKSV